MKKKKGGKLIYKGKNVCLFTPEIPCKKTKKITDMLEKKIKNGI